MAFSFLGPFAPETPPRAWGRRTLAKYKLGAFRNTPTGVGKTEEKFRENVAWQKHPHGRGEDP